MREGGARHLFHVTILLNAGSGHYGSATHQSSQWWLALGVSAMREGSARHLFHVTILLNAGSGHCGSATHQCSQWWLVLVLCADAGREYPSPWVLFLNEGSGTLEVLRTRTASGGWRLSPFSCDHIFERRVGALWKCHAPTLLDIANFMND